MPRQAKSPVPARSKYKQLRGAVQSYTQGFTSIIWPGFSDLARFAWCTDTTTYEIDFLARTISPDPGRSVAEGFFDYRDLAEWFEQIGCSLCHIRRFQMRVDFDLSTEERHRYATSEESCMRFQAHSELEDDRGKVYRYDYNRFVWFR